MADDFSPIAKFRSLSGAARTSSRLLLSALTALGALWVSEIHQALSWALFKEQYLGLFFALALTNIFIGVKARASEPGKRVPWYDWLLAVTSLLVGGYVTVMYPTIAYRLGVLSLDRWLLGSLAVILILEAARRVVGWALVWIAATFILYAKFAYLFPGILNGKGSSWPRISSFSISECSP